MTKQFVKDALGWGVVLWLVGYVLGIVLFMAVPPAMLGWSIMPIGVAVALWILFTRVQATAFPYYFWLAIVWVLIAIVFDHFFLVKLFKPADGYYKLDVYVYYALTLLLPLLVGWRKETRQK